MPTDVDLLRISLKDRHGRGPADGEYTVHGFAVDVETSPCCFMYEGYGLQVKVTMPDGRSEFYCHTRAVDPRKATRADVQSLIEGQSERATCSCAAPFLRGVRNTDRRAYTHLCQPCRLARIQAEYEAEVEKEEQEEKKRDAEKKAEGYTCKVVAWLHPAAGEDREVVVYFDGNPSKQDIVKHLKMRGCQRGDDFVREQL